MALGLPVDPDVKVEIVESSLNHARIKSSTDFFTSSGASRYIMLYVSTKLVYGMKFEL